MHNMGVLVRKEAKPKPGACSTCGCKWGYLDTTENAIKCGQCDRILEYK